MTDLAFGHVARVPRYHARMTERKVEGLTVKAAVLVGFGLTLGLWFFVGYDVTGRMGDVERQSAQVNVRYMLAQELLATVRSRCPRCAEILEARPLTRTTRVHDLECRDCKRYFERTPAALPESLYIFRIQKLATAILRA